MYRLFLILLSIVFLNIACSAERPADERPLVVTTTMMLEDAVKQIAGDKLNIVGLMGPGVDPHMYRATPRDIRNLDRASLIIYNGLFLEARLAEILSKMGDRAFAAAEVLDRDSLIEAYEFGGNFDPHVWFDVSLWAKVVQGVANKLIVSFPEFEAIFRQNLNVYLDELANLDEWTRSKINQIPKNKRVLITAHDAFQYFGRAYNIEVMGLQGLNTQSEAGIQDISRLADIILEREIPAIFLETSVPPRTIRSLINSVKQQGGSVQLGGELYSDAMGMRGTPAGTYSGMIEANVRTIKKSLLEVTHGSK